MSYWKFRISRILYKVPGAKSSSWFEEGFLISPDGTRWHANSGGWGNGPLPPGRYRIGATTPVYLQDTNFTAMRDRNGFAWKTELSDTMLRSRLRVHPDGSVRGTLGCIGIDIKHHPDTRTVYEALNKSKGGTLIVSGGILDDSSAWG